jgi:SAM-dependent methyltransferase
MFITEIKRDYQRLMDFVEIRKNDVYKEPNDNESFIRGGIDTIKHRVNVFDKVLDVGCGHGVALDIFTELGAKPIGITLSEEDARASRFRGHDVRMMDMSFTDFEDGYFDVVWARHSLEHSLFPYFTLTEFYRLLKKGGVIYLEMPGIRTPAFHETNSNHYSVFDGVMWANLIFRSGFKKIESYTITFSLRECGLEGDDLYYRFIGEK